MVRSWRIASSTPPSDSTGCCAGSPRSGARVLVDASRNSTRTRAPEDLRVSIALGSSARLRSLRARQRDRASRTRPGWFCQVGHLAEQRRGKVSMTNQPRSSRWRRRSTCRRPTCPRGRGTQPSRHCPIRERRSWSVPLEAHRHSRGIAASSSRSIDPVRNSSGGAGSSSRVSTRPRSVRGYIARERPVGEGDRTLDRLLHGDGLGQ